MMNLPPQLYDQHVHTSFSPDSQEPLESIVIQAVERGRASVVTTDHVDYGCTFFGKDVEIEMEAYLAEAERLRSLYPVDLLLGCEIGFREDWLERIRIFAASYPFDVVLGSVHNNGTVDYSLEPFHQWTIEEKFRDYFLHVQKAITQWDGFDIAAHLDYFVRYTPKPVTADDYLVHRDLICDILAELIRKDKVLELNTAGLYRQGWIHPHPLILRWFTDLGGRYLSLGSDAHQASHTEKGFPEAIELLAEFGIREVVVFKRRKPRLISL